MFGRLPPYRQQPKSEVHYQSGNLCVCPRRPSALNVSYIIPSVRIFLMYVFSTLRQHKVELISTNRCTRLALWRPVVYCESQLSNVVQTRSTRPKAGEEWNMRPKTPDIIPLSIKSETNRDPLLVGRYAYFRCSAALPPLSSWSRPRKTTGAPCSGLRLRNPGSAICLCTCFWLAL